MSTLSYAYDIGDQIAFANGNGVHKGEIKAVFAKVVPIVPTPISGSLNAVKVSYSVQFVSMSRTHGETQTVDEANIAADLDAAWALYEALAAAS